MRLVWLCTVKRCIVNPRHLKRQFDMFTYESCIYFALNNKTVIFFRQDFESTVTIMLKESFFSSLQAYVRIIFLSDM